jgi:flavin-dependent dehydrogenase
VGIGRFRPGRRVDLRQALKGEMDRLGIGLAGVAVHGHPLPSWPLSWVRPQEPLATRRCLLVGDAAGLVDPLLGEGIRYAIASGRLAAEAIARDDLSAYDRSIGRDIGRSLTMAGRVANTFYRLPRLCYQIGVRNPAVIHLFADLLAERRSYVGIGRQLVALTARWLTLRR